MGNLCSSKNQKTVILDNDHPAKKLKQPTTKINASGNKVITMNKLNLSELNSQKNNLTINCESSDDTDGSGRAQKQYELQMTARAQKMNKPFTK